MTTSETAKFNMIEQQIRPWEVLDHQVLAVIERLDRADFVADAYRGLAYADCQIPVANGVRMLPPTIEGRVLQSLLLEPGDDVLVVGSISGYISTCLACLGGKVHSIDADADIVELARDNASRLGHEGINFEQCSLKAFDAPAQYDAIAVTGSLADVPDNLKQALRVGGRLFVICGHSPVMQALLIRRVSDDEWTRQSLFETDLPRLNQG